MPDPVQITIVDKPDPTAFWEKYLPGRQLAKLVMDPILVMKPLQVWVFALNCTDEIYEAVVLVDEIERGETVRATLLAKNATVSAEIGETVRFTSSRFHAALVCDVGADPLPPEQVFPWLAPKAHPLGMVIPHSIVKDITAAMDKVLTAIGGAIALRPATHDQLDALAYATYASPPCRAYAPPTLTQIPARLRVSLDGSTWVDYDAMVDPDVFDSYPWRRAGDVVVVPACYRTPTCGGGSIFTKGPEIGKDCTNVATAQGPVAGELTQLCTPCNLERERRIARLMDDRAAARTYSPQEPEPPARSCFPTLAGGVFNIGGGR